jgi:guanylate kinase
MKKPGPDQKVRLPSPLLIVVSAPSGGGKTTLCQQILARHPGMVRAITCTTRPPRSGELDGRDYYFLDSAAFAQRLASGGFLEHATVYNHSYGIPKSEVIDKLQQGSDVLLNVDVQGAATICSRAGQDAALARALVTVFLTPGSVAELEARLKRRGTDSPAELARRLSVARQEIAQSHHFQYLIISTSIAEDARQMETIIDAERLRQSRSAFTLGG